MALPNLAQQQQEKGTHDQAISASSDAFCRTIGDGSRFVLHAKACAPKLTLLGDHHDGPVQRLVEATAAALDSKVPPTLVDDGCGGVYIIKGADGGCVSVFKPSDEEPGALNNPKRERHSFAAPQGAGGMFDGVRVGQGALNEWCAYLLDSSERARGFSRVPPTAAAFTEHSAFWSAGEEHSPFRQVKQKVGSLQRFERAMGCAEDFAPSAYATIAVQRIAVLDIRLFNLDRHGGNMLIRHEGAPTSGADEARVLHITAGALQLIPIDHGFCLPDRPTTARFEWRGWPQARAPLEAAAREYVCRLDAAADAQLLRAAGLPEPSVRTMRIGTLLLQVGTRLGMSLAQIADVMCEPNDAAERGGWGGEPPQHERSPTSVVEPVDPFRTPRKPAPRADAPAAGPAAGPAGDAAMAVEGGPVAMAVEGGPGEGAEEAASLLQRMCETAEAEAAAAAARADVAQADELFFASLARLIEAHALHCTGQPRVP